MPAIVTLSTTTLAAPVDAHSGLVKLSSTSGLVPGTRLFVDKELMSVISLGVDPYVNVRRGQDGTGAAPHSSTSTVYIGRADQFFSVDPIGAPPSFTNVQPHINVLNGKVWYARGNPDPSGDTYRWWQQVGTTYSTGALGVLTRTEDPTAGT